MRDDAHVEMYQYVTVNFAVRGSQFRVSFGIKIRYKCLPSRPHDTGNDTLKTHQMFCVHTASEKFENAAIIGHFGNGNGGKLGKVSCLVIVKSSLLKSSVFKCFQPTLKRKAGVFKFPGLKSVFVEFRFRDGLVWTRQLFFYAWTETC